MKLSVALAVFNEEKNIATCLDSINTFADEIIVVDGGSTDKTVEIVKQYTSRIIYTDNPPIFHINKQKALNACHGTWILQLDADEILTPELKGEISKVINNTLPVDQSEFQNLTTRNPLTRNGQQINGYYIPRRNYFWGHWMKKGGQYPDYVMRLVRNGKAHFPCKSVHEQIKIDGEAGYLKKSLLHYSYRTFADYWKKADAYTSLTVQEMNDDKIAHSLNTLFFYCLVKPVKTFFSIFFRHKGFMDGFYGLVFAYWSALHYPIAYHKYNKLTKLNN